MLDPYTPAEKTQQQAGTVPSGTPAIPGLNTPMSMFPALAEHQQAAQGLQRNAIEAQQQQVQAQIAQEGRQASREMSAYANDPSTQGKGWNEIDPARRADILSRYPNTAPQIPGMFNSAQSSATGRPVGVKVQDGEQVSGDVPGGFKFQNIQPTATDNTVDPATGAPISSNRQEIIDGIKSGQLPASSIAAMSRRNPQLYMSILGEVRRENPDWTPQAYQAQQKARDSFVGDAKNAQMILNANTLIHHLGALSDATNQLGNTGTPAVNWVKNTWDNATGATAPGNFDNIASAVAEEKTKLMRGGVPDAATVAHERALLNANKAPEQIKGQIAANVNLMQGKLQELENQWKQSVGMQRNIPFLGPEARQILQGKLGIDPNTIDPVGGAQGQPAQPAAPATPATPPTINSQAEYDKLPSGTRYMDSHGKTATKK